jgi:glutamate synthase (NADPH/NADH) small chain
MPASDEEIEEAKEEGVAFSPGWGPKEVLLDDSGRVCGLRCVKVRSVFNDEGRFAPTFHEDQEMVLEGTMVIEAIGQGPDLSFISEETMRRLEFTPFKKVAVDENGMTSLDGVFAGGDIVNKNMDAVTAIADAKTAAEGINKRLRPS